MSEENTTKDFEDLYADLSACFLALANALENAGVLSKAKIAEAAQERLLGIQPTGKPEHTPPHPLYLLHTLAISLATSPIDPT